MVTIQVTILFEKKFWVALFERIDKEGYEVAKHIFGAEPSDTEVYDFVLTHYQELKFGEKKEFELKIKRMNPKRLQREVRKEMEKVKMTEKPSSYAQDYMKEQLEVHKKEKKQKKSALAQERKDSQFLQKQEKKKRKKKGH